MESTEILIKTTVKPKRMIYHGEPYKINSADDMFTITKYKIYVTKNKVYRLEINAKHPNYDDNSRKFCLPSCIKEKDISDKLIQLIEDVLSTFNLDNCYYSVWGKIKYSKWTTS